MLGLGDDPPLLVPSFSLVLELGEESHFVATSAVLTFGASVQLGRKRVESLVLGQSDNIVDSRTLAPTQHLPPAKATVGSQDDLYFWPVFPQGLDQQRQDCPSVFS